MTQEQACIGTRVKSLVDFSGVKAGTEGVIDEVYELNGRSGVTVAWDLIDQPLPEGYKQHDGTWAVNHRLLRDGFAVSELKYLEVCTL